MATKRMSRIDGRVAAVALAIGGILVLGAVALPRAASGGATTTLPAAIGEHSALGDRRVDELNAAIASMQRLRGEHAGLSRQDYEAGAALDGAAR